MEKAVFMMYYLNITQKANNEFSHKGDKAIDIAGKDSGIDNFKAPFTGVIKKYLRLIIQYGLKVKIRLNMQMVL